MQGSTRCTGSSTRWRFPRYIFIISFLITVFVAPASGKDFTVSRNLQGYTLVTAINRNPPILGKNEIKVDIKDSLGKHVIDAPVSINYFMPPMPGMSPMNYKVKAAPAGSGYRATMDLIMQGPWNIVISAGVGGKQLRMTVLIDVR
mgnify:CR=1 FL=1